MSWSTLPLGLDLLLPNYFFAFCTSQPSVPCLKQILALPIILILLLGFIRSGKHYKMRVTWHTTINYTYQSKKTPNFRATELFSVLLKHLSYPRFIQTHHLCNTKSEDWYKLCSGRFWWVNLGPSTTADVIIKGLILREAMDGQGQDISKNLHNFCSILMSTYKIL